MLQIAGAISLVLGGVIVVKGVEASWVRHSGATLGHGFDVTRTGSEVAGSHADLLIVVAIACAGLGLLLLATIPTPRISAVVGVVALVLGTLALAALFRDWTLIRLRAITGLNTGTNVFPQPGFGRTVLGASLVVAGSALALGGGLDRWRRILFFAALAVSIGLIAPWVDTGYLGTARVTQRDGISVAGPVGWVLLIIAMAIGLACIIDRLVGRSIVPRGVLSRVALLTGAVGVVLLALDWHTVQTKRFLYKQSHVSRFGFWVSLVGFAALLAVGLWGWALTKRRVAGDVALMDALSSDSVD